jgi:hypothetical protein
MNKEKSNKKIKKILECQTREGKMIYEERRKGEWFHSETYFKLLK